VDASGAAKLWVTSRTLRLRRSNPDAFAGYAPLAAQGSAADHLVAYDRGGVIALATRLPVGLARSGGWGDTVLALPAPVRDELTGATFSGEVRVADVLATYPVALLVKTA
jgi:(1->4)-alpha-D-glucan 1-alpha-D-glucosylmutase